MNIKRTFFAMAAALLLPGLAMAGTTSFVVDFSFDDGNDWDTVNARIVCNGGLPLTNERGVTDGDVITFVLEFSEAGPNIADCHIFVDGLANYTASYRATRGNDVNLGDIGNPTVAETGCFFRDVPVNDPPQRQCFITLTPNPGIMTVHKEWEIFGQGTDDLGIRLRSTIRACSNRSDVILDSQRFSARRFCNAQSVFGTDTAWVDFTVNTRHDPGFDIWIEEDNADSVVETDLGDCDDDFNFQPGSNHECTIVNTVFFEGIPTLNQYGLAIMALLMLAVGFVGFRRFV